MARPQRWDQCLCQNMPCYKVDHWGSYANTSDQPRWHWAYRTRNSSTLVTTDYVCHTVLGKKLKHEAYQSYGWNDLFNAQAQDITFHGEVFMESTWNPLRGIWEGSATTSIQEPDYPYQINIETFPRNQTDASQTLCTHMWISSSTGDVTPKLGLEHWAAGGGAIYRAEPTLASTTCALSVGWSTFWSYLPKFMKSLPKGFNVIVSSTDPFSTNCTTTGSTPIFGTFYLADSNTLVSTTGSTVHPNCNNAIQDDCSRNWNHTNYWYAPATCAGPTGTTYGDGCLSGIELYTYQGESIVTFNFGGMQSRSQVRAAREYRIQYCATAQTTDIFDPPDNTFKYFRDNTCCASSTGWINFTGSSATVSSWSYPAKVTVEFGGFY